MSVNVSQYTSMVFIFDHTDWKLWEKCANKNKQFNIFYMENIHFEIYRTLDVKSNGKLICYFVWFLLVWMMTGHLYGNEIHTHLEFWRVSMHIAYKSLFYHCALEFAVSVESSRVNQIYRRFIGCKKNYSSAHGKSFTFKYLLRVHWLF